MRHLPAVLLFIILSISSASGQDELELATTQPAQESAFTMMLPTELEPGELFSPKEFFSNGTYQKDYDLYWLSSPNILKFNKKYKAEWYFEGLPVGKITAKNEFIVKVNALVMNASMESGGKPSSANVRLTVVNPTEEKPFVVSKVTLQTTRTLFEVPAYLYVPASQLGEGGRLIVRIEAAGQIGFNLSRCRVIVEE